jgi:hypothetical protein
VPAPSSELRMGLWRVLCSDRRKASMSRADRRCRERASAFDVFVQGFPVRHSRLPPEEIRGGATLTAGLGDGVGAFAANRVRARA